MESVLLISESSTPNITVSDPIKHGEGTQAFVSFLVTSDVQVRRRFQDFISLHQLMTEEYPQLIIPPLPNKHRMEYVVGDRFGEEFLLKRQQGLQIFMDRIARHPVLKSSNCLEKFLKVDQMAHVIVPKKETVLDNLGDYVLNALSKIKNPDMRFVEVKEK